MIISKKRIRTIKQFEQFWNQRVRFGISDIDRFESRLREVGFSSLRPGESVLPSVVGPVSLRNAEGDYVKHKDLPMETFYRLQEWRREQWAGRGKTELVIDLVEVPYQRYPRTFVAPFSVELEIQLSALGNAVVVTPAMLLTDEASQDIIHTVNLILEIFGECQVFTDDSAGIMSIPVKRLNWEVLPPGPIPWTEIRKRVDPIVSKHGPRTRSVIYKRFELLHSLGPDFYALGNAGFRGYVVFGYSKKSIFVLESTYPHNATYVLGEDWEEISRLSKAEILDTKLHQERIIHRLNWESRVRQLLA